MHGIERSKSRDWEIENIDGYNGDDDNHWISHNVFTAECDATTSS